MISLPTLILSALADLAGRLALFLLAAVVAGPVLVLAGAADLLEMR